MPTAVVERGKGHGGKGGYGKDASGGTSWYRDRCRVHPVGDERLSWRALAIALDSMIPERRTVQGIVIGTQNRPTYTPSWRRTPYFDPRFARWVADGSIFGDSTQRELYQLIARYQSEKWKIMAVDGLATILRSHDDQPGVYTYAFLWDTGGMKKSVMPPPYGLLMGSCHAIALDFVFGTEAIFLDGCAFDRKKRPGGVALPKAIGLTGPVRLNR